MMNVDVKIKRQKQCFAVYIDGKFYCTADNEKEAAQEVREYERNGGIYHANNHTQKKLQNSRVV